MSVQSGWERWSEVDSTSCWHMLRCQVPVTIPVKVVLGPGHSCLAILCRDLHRTSSVQPRLLETTPYSAKRRWASLGLFMSSDISVNDRRRSSRDARMMLRSIALPVVRGLPDLRPLDFVLWNENVIFEYFLLIIHHIRASENC